MDGTDGVPQYIAIAAAHEAGHGFGLNHQSVFGAAGNLTAEYNPGDSTEAPIMGLAYSAQRALWWDGPSDVNGVDVYQNDEAVIADATNGFGYRPDYYGQSEQTATPLTVLNGQVGDSGVINAPSSADYFTFITSGGAASFTVNTVAVGPTLHAKVALYSTAGLIAVGDQRHYPGRVALDHARAWQILRGGDQLRRYGRRRPVHLVRQCSARDGRIGQRRLHHGGDVHPGR